MLAKVIRYTLFSIAIAIIGLVIYGKVLKNNEPTKTYDAERAQALDALNNTKEATIKIVRWYDETTLYVGVDDDGSKRDGLAQSTCYTLHQYGLKGAGINIRIIDSSVMNTPSEWELLGSARC